MDDPEPSKIITVGTTPSGQPLELVIYQDGKFRIRSGGLLASVLFDPSALDEVLKEFAKK